MFFSEKDCEKIEEIMHPSIQKIYKHILALQDALIIVQKAILLLQAENKIKRNESND